MSDTARLSEAELDGLIRRLEEAIEHDLSLSAEDMKLLLQALLSLVHLQERLGENDITLHKLRKLSGIVNQSEKLKDLLPGAGKGKRNRKKTSKSSAPKTPPVEHQRCHHQLKGLKKGELCPECERGKLYKYSPATFVQVSGQSPLVSTRHILERLRCNACGQYFTAEMNTDDGEVGQSYGYSARALMALHKYFGGTPFYRQQSLQQLFGFSVSAATVFDQCQALSARIQPLMEQLQKLAANAEHYHLDDTGNRILDQKSSEIADRRSGKMKQRSGVYSSGLIARLATGEQIILFKTNIGHAGEWIDEILLKRAAQAPPPIIMGDALSRNKPSVIKQMTMSLCNAHGRRGFADVAQHFPDEVEWVLKRYGTIWQHDDQSTVLNHNAEQRQLYHKQHSLPVMEEIQDWCEQQLATGAVEENGGLGQAMTYFLKHFEGLSQFCHTPGAVLDNNAMEAALKLVIRGRKNAMFFKTQAGADVADTLTSLIATCHQAGINTFEYLILLQRHASEVRRRPHLWLPWNYTEAVMELWQAEAA